MKELILSKIKESPQHRLSVADYMNHALYDSEHGYYMKARPKVGKAGDFYTSSSVSSVFAELIADVVLSTMKKEQLPFHFCEIGGGTGRFASDFLNYIKKTDGQAYQHFQYELVETSPYHQTCQQELLSSENGVTFHSSIEAVIEKYPSFEGIVFSNELFDAFPVHVVEKNKHTVHEIFISEQDGDLVQIKDVCNNSSLLHWLTKYGPPLVNGQRIEVPLFMNSWFRKLGDWFTRGVILTIDYGYTKAEWQEPERRDGSLRGYYQHQMITNPCQYPGEMDLTSHIHIDALIEIGKEHGFEPVYVDRQDKFLLHAGILNWLQDHYDPNPFSEQSKRNRAIRSLIMDGGISQSFYVIGQAKNAHSLTFKGG
ncbi:class I SAM-dependent methyltransferase [Bacillus alkalicellulosilyticus]|uniref:class I SAM-dependent methyltransferase n=1 Tax=Alkalihalobacterium alkalicellulosilyticum TaxID=1912214 RepID=UPI00099609CE|nr:SAM-dependent methyltransferase [Bacillus alkalicellulosilyticus]